MATGLRISDVLISIHALREEGDLKWSCRETKLSHFNPRPPRGGRRRQLPPQILHKKFQSTPSARRATHTDAALDFALNISIHALREEGDAAAQCRWPYNMRFQSTPSARRATC